MTAQFVVHASLPARVAALKDVCCVSVCSECSNLDREVNLVKGCLVHFVAKRAYLVVPLGESEHCFEKKWISVALNCRKVQGSM